MQRIRPISYHLNKFLAYKNYPTHSIHIILMKQYFILLLIICAVSNSCTHKCLRVESHIALVSYLPAETEAVIVRRFEKNSGFATAKDTFSLTRLTSSYQNKNDTLEIFGSYGTDNGLLSTYDYEIYLPAVNRLYQVTEITETFESMNSGLSCTKENCLNTIRSYKVNGQLMNGNPEYAFYLVK